MGRKHSEIDFEKISKLQEKYRYYMPAIEKNKHSWTVANEGAVENGVLSFEKQHNPILHPSHYQFKKPCKEVRDVIRDRLNRLHGSSRVYPARPGDLAYDYANTIKYLLRWSDKNGLEDLKKAKFCLDSMIALFEEEIEKSKQNERSIP